MRVILNLATDSRGPGFDRDLVLLHGNADGMSIECSVSREALEDRFGLGTTVKELCAKLLTDKSWLESVVAEKIETEGLPENKQVQVLRADTRRHLPASQR